MMTVNGRRHYDLESTLANSRDFVGSVIARLDGKARYSVVLGTLPPDHRIGDVDLKTWPKEYIQCAGSSAAMTVEMRIVLGGEATQLVVGRSPEPRAGEPDVTIPWDEFEVKVFEEEVFDAEEATEMFAAYLVAACVPPEFSLRRLDLRRS
jgi:hypothetical protein